MPRFIYDQIILDPYLKKIRQDFNFTLRKDVYDGIKSDCSAGPSLPVTDAGKHIVTNTLGEDTGVWTYGVQPL